MSCCIGWWHPEAMMLFEGLPCNDYGLEEDVPGFEAPAPTPDGPLVRLGSVSKSFGRITALDDLTFEVERSSVAAVRGSPPSFVALSGWIGRIGAGRKSLVRTSFC
jgi:hypothetical protein